MKSRHGLRATWGCTVALGAMVACAFAQRGAAPPRGCTQKDAINAEEEASTLKSWVEVFRSYKRYGQCDDAAIAEGYSDSVARLLSERWGSSGELNRLCSRNRGFEKFVLRHVDELMTPQQARTILKNAKSRCPKGAFRLCREISGRINAMDPLGK
jgi:hypothetical protein